MRTHDPDTSADACTWFDGRVRDTFRAITQARLDDNDWLVAGLPPRHGGVGLYTASVFRSAAFQASHDAACATEGVPACAQSVAVEEHFKEVRSKLVANDPALERLLTECSQRGAGSWLTDIHASWSPTHFAAAVRHRLNVPHKDDPDVLLCPGCRRTFPAKQIYQHAPGCVRVSGANASTKHNAIVLAVLNDAKSAGLTTTREPREFASYQCRGCHRLFPPDLVTEHAAKCAPHTKPRHSGPDGRVIFADEDDSVVFDVTVIHSTAPSHARTERAQLLKDKVQAKTKLYEGMVSASSERFLVLAIYSHGAIPIESRAFLQRIADMKEVPRADVEAAVTNALQRGNGANADRVHRYNLIARRRG